MIAAPESSAVYARHYLSLFTNHFSLLKREPKASAVAEDQISF